MFRTRISQKWLQINQILYCSSLKYSSSPIIKYHFTYRNTSYYKLILVSINVNILGMGCSSSSLFQQETRVNIQKSLISVINTGQTDTAIQILKQSMEKHSDDFDLNASINFNHDTLLHYSAFKNDEKLTNFILENNGNPNIMNRYQELPSNKTSDPKIKTLLESAGRNFKEIPQLIEKQKIHLIIE